LTNGFDFQDFRLFLDELGWPLEEFDLSCFFLYGLGFFATKEIIRSALNKQEPNQMNRKEF
jgi:hypothetical protein